MEAEVTSAGHAMTLRDRAIVGLVLAPVQHRAGRQAVHGIGNGMQMGALAKGYNQKCKRRRATVGTGQLPLASLRGLGHRRCSRGGKEGITFGRTDEHGL